MKLIYQCPKCKAALNAKRNIILAASSSSVKENKGLVLLHEELGNYTVATTPSLTVETGDKVNFFCPVCHESIDSREGENLASFIRIDENGEESVIVISRIYGERCTFQVDDKKEVKSYGDSVKKFLNPEWFL
ncbi:MAG: hypothetical protein K9G76_04455 [Bacteroidales bacterium]|nr:hypothetical protein [Bacteroidales bacterium]MCF8403676.1 hypothetical protein [Bacteroidales bacterium]